MKKRIATALLLACVTLAVLLATGCQGDRIHAIFVRYQDVPGAERVAIIEVPGQVSEMAAQTDMDDLEPGDEVWIENVGRDWDQPQSIPTAVIVDRK